MSKLARLHRSIRDLAHRFKVTFIVHQAPVMPERPRAVTQSWVFIDYIDRLLDGQPDEVPCTCHQGPGCNAARHKFVIEQATNCSPDGWLQADTPEGKDLLALGAELCEVERYHGVLLVRRRVIPSRLGNRETGWCNKLVYPGHPRWGEARCILVPGHTCPCQEEAPPAGD